MYIIITKMNLSMSTRTTFIYFKTECYKAPTQYRCVVYFRAEYYT